MEQHARATWLYRRLSRHGAGGGCDGPVTGPAVVVVTTPAAHSERYHFRPVPIRTFYTWPFLLTPQHSWSFASCAIDLHLVEGVYLQVDKYPSEGGDINVVRCARTLR